MSYLAGVTIVMTVYNRELFVKDAITSVINQTYLNWNLLIWDDGSTDNSVFICESFCKIDDRIKLIYAKHQGQTKSLLHAMKLAQTLFDNPYFGWLDSDDILHQEALSSTIQILNKNTSIGVVYTDYININEHSQILRLGSRCQIPYCKNKLLISFMTFHFRLIRFDLYNLVGGIDPNIFYVQDYDLCLKLSEVTDIYHLPLILYFYRNHSTNVSTTQSEGVLNYSYKAVNNALIRRNLHHLIKLTITPEQQFKLVSLN